MGGKGGKRFFQEYNALARRNHNQWNKFLDY